jgi:hypothetical protein
MPGHLRMLRPRDRDRRPQDGGDPDGHLIAGDGDVDPTTALARRLAQGDEWECTLPHSMSEASHATGPITARPAVPPHPQRRRSGSMLMTMIRTLLASATLACVAGCATATYVRGHSTIAGDGSNSDAAWAAYDTDGDGYLSIQELERQHAVGLLRDRPIADTNADGKVSREEWNAWWPLMTKPDISSSMAAMNENSAPNGWRSR